MMQGHDANPFLRGWLEPPYERRRKFITKFHADLVCRACIFFLMCFSASGSPVRKILIDIGMLYPVLSFHGLKSCKLAFCSDLVPISFWSGPFIGFSGLAVSYLVLQACISFYRVSDKCGALLFLPCSERFRPSRAVVKVKKIVDFCHLS